MAEEEKIMEHAKKAVQSLTTKNKKWKDKLKDFLFEILIIIVAVNITLWFHSWSDRRHDREIEKNFLIDLRQNINDNTGMLNDMINYFTDSMLHYYDTVLVQVKIGKIDTQYINSNSYLLLAAHTSNLDFGLFESFKSAGNLRLIENQNLLTDITNEYSAELPYREEHIERVLDGSFSNFDKYVGRKIGNFNKSLSFSALSMHLNDPDVLYFIQRNDAMIYFLTQNMQATVSRMNRLGSEIDKELEDRFGYKAKKKK
jgi:hypothetical protein